MHRRELLVATASPLVDAFLPPEVRCACAAEERGRRFFKVDCRQGARWFIDPKGNPLRLIVNHVKTLFSLMVLIVAFTVGQAATAQPPLPGRPSGGPWNHRVLSAASKDGLTWVRDEGVRIDHASVPCAVADGKRILLYYVDADRGPGQAESVGCAVSTDGLHFEKRPFVIDGLPTRKALDPSVLCDRDGTFRLYYLASSAPGDPAAEERPHEVHLALSKDGVRFRNVGLAFRHARLVDPDVFCFKGTWFMYVFGGGDTVIAMSADGRDFTYKQPLALRGWGTVAPVQLEADRLRLYAFDQRKHSGNAVRSFTSSNGLDWTEEEGDRLVAADNEQITDPFVVPWNGGYKMFFKAEQRSGDRSAPGPRLEDFRPQPGPEQQPPREGPAGGGPGRPPKGVPGPWNNDVLVYRVSAGGEVAQIATFERAGVPTLARLQDGRLIAAHQHFPENDEAGFDKVAVRFSSDEGKTWTPPQVIRLSGLPEGMRFPFDPTLVPLPDGRVRLYFTSLRGRRFEESVPAIYSAVSDSGVAYTFEPGARFGIEGRIVIDCAVVLHQGVFHLYAPENGPQPRRGEGPGQEPAGTRPRAGVGYHATSSDGLNFTRAEDVRIEGARRWLGGAQSDGKRITFFGTGDPAEPGVPGARQPRGGVWMATSGDGQLWKLVAAPPIPVADPGAVAARDGGWVVVGTGPPRRGTPGAEGRRRPAGLEAPPPRRNR